MKAFAITVLTLLTSFFLLVTVSAVSTAFNQIDTLTKKEVKKRSEKVPVDTPLVVLKQMSEQKDVDRDMLKDSIAQNLDALEKLVPKAQQNNAIIKVAENNLKETILKSDGGVQAIERTYRIDTSPRPVVIQVMFPDNAPEPRKRWFRRRD